MVSRDLRLDLIDSIHTNTLLLVEYRVQLEEETFKKLFKFTCVRNPWERLISYFFSPHRGLVSWNRDHFIKFIDKVSPLAANLALVEGIVSSLKAFNGIDYFIRFENLNDDFKKVCNQIDIPWESLPVRNKSNKQHYANYYDRELVELVYKKYSDEITYFGYDYNHDT